VRALGTGHRVREDRPPRGEGTRFRREALANDSPEYRSEWLAGRVLTYRQPWLWTTAPLTEVRSRGRLRLPADLGSFAARQA